MLVCTPVDPVILVARQTEMPMHNLGRDSMETLRTYFRIEARIFARRRNIGKFIRMSISPSLIISVTVCVLPWPLFLFENQGDGRMRTEQKA